MVTKRNAVGHVTVTTTALSRALGPSTKTITRYIKAGILDGHQQPSRHYTDDRERKTGRAHYLVTLESVERLIRSWYSDDNVPAGVKRWLIEAKRSR